MKTPPLKIGLMAAAAFAVLAMTSCTYDPYGYYGSSYGSYTYSNYPYGYTTAYLPRGYSSVYIGGTRYWHCNNHYYRHYPGRGYVVVKRPPGHHGGHYVKPSHHRPAKYAQSQGHRYNKYQNQVGHSNRYGNRNSASRYNTVRTQPAQVTPRPAPRTTRQAKSRPSNQSSTWSNNNSSGGGSIQRNPAPFSPPKFSQSQRSAPTRSSSSRGNSSRRGKF